VPRNLKLFEAEGLHRKKPLLGLEIDTLLRKDRLLFRLLEVEMFSVKQALLLMFEQDRLHRKKALFWGCFEP
jgi:hypothetical protein